jgi:folate-binding protein YgfZ
MLCGSDRESDDVKSALLMPLHRAERAEISAGDAPLVLTFGEVPDEYRAAQTACAVFDQTERELVEVAGPDASAFLHRLLANTVRTLVAGEGNANLLLSSKGKVLFDFDLAVQAERITLSTPRGQAAALLKALDTYHFSEKLSLRDASDEHAPLALCGPLARDIVARVTGVASALDDHAHARGEFDGGPVAVTPLPVAGSPGWRLDAGPARAEKLWRALRAAGAVPAGRVAYDCLRVEAGAAEAGVDIDDNVYPQEARLERAFSLDKGCYIGQEVVAKIDTYGGLNKRLTALRVGHDDPVARGTRLFREDEGEWRDLGVVTSWAYSFVLDTGLVLAYVKRRHQDVGTRFRLGDAEAALGEASIVALPVRTNAIATPGG